MSQRIFPITMPKWGIEMQQGTITEWHAVPGGALAKGAPLLDVETEKIVNSVEAPVAGTLRKIVAETGSTESVGALIAVFADASVPDAEIDAFIAGFKPADASFDHADAPAAPTAAPAAVDAAADGEARISPIARRIAERLGVDITQVKGTGRNGRVSKEDVEAYAASIGVQADGTPAAAPAAGSAAAPAAATGAAGDGVVREKMTSMRATIARRLLESKQGIPHYRLAADVDLTALLARRAALRAAGTEVSVNDLLVRACALTLVKHPAVNAQLQGDEVHKFPHADIAVAVATDGGLVTPIVRSADTKSAAQIGAETGDLATRARSGKLTREEITGGTFTLSNLGMFGIDRFDAIINPPQVAILAVGAGADRVIARGGSVVVAKVATLTLSCDHRVVDGAIGAQFLQALRQTIESADAL
jgi:pyruvate dehydrogenase E2 component (dihydrolipoamide acetyltransferase)